MNKVVKIEKILIPQISSYKKEEMMNIKEIFVKKYDNIDGNVFHIINDFFGHSINVAGLITGTDLIAQLKGKELGKRLLIPVNMLRDGEGVFLDDVTVDEVRSSLNVEIVPVEQDGGAFLRAITGNF